MMWTVEGFGHSARYDESDRRVWSGSPVSKKLFALAMEYSAEHRSTFQASIRRALREKRVPNRSDVFTLIGIDRPQSLKTGCRVIVDENNIRFEGLDSKAA